MQIYDDRIYKIMKAITPLVQKYHISLGSGLNAPTGSGTLIRFDIDIDGAIETIYGILTASHIAFEILTRDAEGKSWITLYKPLSDGSMFEQLRQSPFIYHWASKEEFTSGYEKNDKENHAPDIAFIALATSKNIHTLPSEFIYYQIDNTETQSENGKPIGSAFFRGACLEHEEDDKILTGTGPYIGCNGTLKFDEKYKINYYEVPNKKYSIKGASGAFFWKLFKDGDNISQSFAGVLTSQTLGDSFFVTASCSIKSQFLPDLKSYTQSILATSKKGIS